MVLRRKNFFQKNISSKKICSNKKFCETLALLKRQICHDFRYQFNENWLNFNLSKSHGILFFEKEFVFEKSPRFEKNLKIKNNLQLRSRGVKFTEFLSISSRKKIFFCMFSKSTKKNLKKKFNPASLKMIYRFGVV